jgi:hypothetical protein
MIITAGRDGVDLFGMTLIDCSAVLKIVKVDGVVMSSFKNMRSGVTLSSVSVAHYVLREIKP